MKDKSKEYLRTVHDLNNEVAWMLVDAIDGRPEALERALKDKRMREAYLDQAYRKADAGQYMSDPYYAAISFPDVSEGEWEFCHETVDAGEPFVCGELLLTDDFREIPQVRYFDEVFSYPVVKQGGREWMAVKPNEIETMKMPLQKVSGRVLTLGLGLGYFTYMASLKEDVSDVTVVEHDPQVISLLKKYLLPQFLHPEKVRIVEGDAFDILSSLNPEDYDWVFMDIWHDAQDGLPLYLRAKPLEKPGVNYLYWVEETLLSAYRWQLFDDLMEMARSYEQASHLLSDDFLRKLASSS